MGLYQYDSTEDKLNLVAGSTNFSDAPVGAIFPFGGTDIPVSFLLCDGSAVSRTDYADLFNVIGTAFGTGDGSTTFNLPDLREAVPKGAGLTGLSSNHMDSAGLALGEFIDDRTMSELGIITTGAGSYNVNNSTGGGTYYKVSSNRHGATTEVKSVGVNYIIKAKMVALPADFLAKVEQSMEEVLPITSGSASLNMTRTTIDTQTGSWYRIGKIVFAEVGLTVSATQSSNDYCYIDDGMPAMDVLKGLVSGEWTCNIYSGILGHSQKDSTSSRTPLWFYAQDTGAEFNIGQLALDRNAAIQVRFAYFTTD